MVITPNEMNQSTSNEKAERMWVERATHIIFKRSKYLLTKRKLMKVEQKQNGELWYHPDDGEPFKITEAEWELMEKNRVDEERAKHLVDKIMDGDMNASQRFEEVVETGVDSRGCYNLLKALYDAEPETDIERAHLSRLKTKFKIQ
jgi:phosphoenolpyruvate synthase/pyruvate phosphate dikinase